MAIGRRQAEENRRRRVLFELRRDLAEAQQGYRDTRIQFDAMHREIDRLREMEARLRTDLEVMANGANHARGEHARAMRSIAFFRNMWSDLADEVGLAVEDVAGIVRAVKARDCAGRRAHEAEVALAQIAGSVHAWIDEGGTLDVSASAVVGAVEDLLERVGRSRYIREEAHEMRKILLRIGGMVGVKENETVESAVERVIKGRS